MDRAPAVTIVRTKTPSGEAIVILPEAEFERLRELAEDSLDARAIDLSQDRLDAGEEELLSEADLDALRAAASPLAFWRARRGTSIDSLARDCGVPSTMITALEDGRRHRRDHDLRSSRAGFGRRRRGHRARRGLNCHRAHPRDASSPGSV